MRFCKFNDEGIKEFKSILANNRAGLRDEITNDLLESNQYSDPLGIDFQMPATPITTRGELALHVLEQFEKFGKSKTVNLRDKGIWAWLSAVLFDTVCPLQTDKTRSPGADARHIPTDNYKSFYRHLIRNPVRTVHLFADDPSVARVVLCQSPSKPGDIVEQLTSRQERITSKAVISVASTLYFDENTGQPKKGAGSTTGKAGSLRRYLYVLDQLDLTYDLYSISAEDLLEILPVEFNEWK